MTQIYKQTSRSNLYNAIMRAEEQSLLPDGMVVKRPGQGSTGLAFNLRFDQFALYKSQEHIYFDNERPNPSLIRKEFSEIEILAMKKKVEQFCIDNMTAEVAKSELSYANNQWYHARGTYYARMLFNNFLEYGFNNGAWSEDDRFNFSKANSIFLDQLDFTHLNHCQPIHKDVDYSTMEWNDVLMMHPYLEILDQSKRSGFPKYFPQNIDNQRAFLSDWKNKGYEPESYVGTAYMRTQGGKWDDLNEKTLIIWKVRDVVGSTYPIKVKGAPVTHVFKESQPDYSPYYKDGNIVHGTVRKAFTKCYDDKDKIVFTLDIHGCDQGHTNVNYEPVIDNINERILSEVDANVALPMVEYVNECKKSMTNPIVVWNVRQASQGKKGVIYSLSGNPIVPMVQTTSVMSSAIVALLKTLEGDVIPRPDLNMFQEFMDNHVILMLDQIDDFLYAGTRCPDIIKLVGEYITDHFGLVINIGKVEDSDKGYVCLLKVNTGRLYLENKIKDILLLDGSDPFITSLGTIFTKLHGLWDKERGNKDDGTPLFYIDESGFTSSELKKASTSLINTSEVAYYNGKRVIGVRKKVQQLLGNLMSYGKTIPVQLLDIYYDFFKGKDCWKQLFQLAQFSEENLIIIKEKDFGFNDYQMLLAFLLKNYKED